MVRRSSIIGAGSPIDAPSGYGAQTFALLQVYIALTLGTIVFTQVTQAVVTRVGVRTVLPAGFALSTAAFVLYARLTVHGHYFPDLFPAFVISGLGLAVVVVPMSIGALTGVRPVDAGIASGLFNTNVQIGGAIGVAVGFRVLAASAAVGAVIAAFMLESPPSAAEPEPEVPHAALEPGSAA